LPIELLTEISSALRFCFSRFGFSSPFHSCWAKGFDVTLSPPVYLPIVGRTMSRRCGEVLKADGKPKMTLCDGLRIGRRVRCVGGAFFKSGKRKRSCGGRLALGKMATKRHGDYWRVRSAGEIPALQALERNTSEGTFALRRICSELTQELSNPRFTEIAFGRSQQDCASVTW
jgi:hypothetical protein